MKDTRVVLIHCGEATVARARAALQAAEGCEDWWDIVEVQNVTPMDAAFNAMLHAADRKFHVQVDADMVLKPHAITFLHEAMRVRPRTWQFACPLWDTLFRRPIMGVKIYRSAIARKYPYSPTRHCETDQIRRAAQAGFDVVGIEPVLPHADVRVLGDHVVPDGRTAFWACLDRGMRQRWLQRGGKEDWFRWIEPYFQLFPAWWAATGDSRYLAGFAGLCASLTAEIPVEWGEKDSSAVPVAWQQYATCMERDPATWSQACGTPAWLLQTWV